MSELSKEAIVSFFELKLALFGSEEISDCLFFIFFIREFDHNNRIFHAHEIFKFYNLILLRLTSCWNIFLLDV